jgi:hypothetical protein
MNSAWTARYVAWASVLSTLLIAGCADPPQIASYTVEKEVPDRMLAAILVHEDLFWFFKLTGPREELSKKKGDFDAFLKSVEITDEGPQWKLPNGWESTQSAPSRERFATIKVPLASKPVELTVTVLGQPPQSSREQFLAANINRWRGQMGQSNMSKRDLDSMSQVDTRSGPAYVVNISGKLKGGGMTAPFAGRGM